MTPSMLSAVTAARTPLAAAEAMSVDDLIGRIRSKDDNVRGDAWQKAGPYGAPALKPLAAVMTDADFEVARSAKRAAWKIVSHAGRPGATRERTAVVAELLPLLKEGTAAPVRREILWMVSELAGDEAVDPVKALLGSAELREDARCVLQRLPGKQPIAALKSALKTVPEDFRPAIADALRARGETVAGYPSRRLVPTKKTA